MILLKICAALLTCTLFLQKSLCIKETKTNAKAFASIIKSETAPLTQKKLFAKINKNIVVKIDSKIIAILRDVKNIDETENVTYTYIGFCKSINRYLFQMQFYERSEYLLLSEKGDKTQLTQIPYISYDNKFLIILSKGIEYPIYINGIQIFEIRNDIIHKKCDYLLKDFQPVELRWNTNKEFLLLCESPTHIAPKKAAYYRINIE